VFLPCLRIPPSYDGWEVFWHRLCGRLFDCNAAGDCQSCRFCFADCGYECEVVNGTESPEECPELMDYLDRHEVPVPVRLGRKRWG
jgi:hypothetical protein